MMNMYRLIFLMTIIGVLMACLAFAEVRNIERLSEEIKPQVENLRGLPFLHDVETIYQSPEELKEVLRRELERTYPGETLRTLEKRLLQFGFVAHPISLEKLFMRLYSQQIAGYYDPLEKKMVLIREAEGETPPPPVPLEMLTQLLVKSMGLSLDTILLSHELTHVLQDQHFDLLALPFEDGRQEDTASAVRALIEGDATLVMIDYVLERQQAGMDATQVPEVAESMRRWTNNPLLRGLNLFQGMPRYIMDNLLFSYLYGFEFVLQLKQRSGWQAINTAYADFPVSTEQILHPKKYFAERDMPTVITLPDLAEHLAGRRELERNTLGEFNVQLLLDGYLPTQEARRAAAGWDGDRFVLYEHEQRGDFFLAWFSTWDSVEEAREFFVSYVRMLDKRLAAAGTISENFSRAVWKTVSQQAVLEIRGRDVLFLQGDAEAFQDEHAPLLWQSTKSTVQP